MGRRMEESDALCDNIKEGHWPRHLEERNPRTRRPDTSGHTLTTDYVCYHRHHLWTSPAGPLVILKLELFKVDALQQGT